MIAWIQPGKRRRVVDPAIGRCTGKVEKTDRGELPRRLGLLDSARRTAQLEVHVRLSGTEENPADKHVPHFPPIPARTHLQRPPTGRCLQGGKPQFPPACLVDPCRHRLTGEFHAHPRPRIPRSPDHHRPGHRQHHVLAIGTTEFQRRSAGGPCQDQEHPLHPPRLPALPLPGNRKHWLAHPTTTGASRDTSPAGFPAHVPDSP